MLLSSLKRDPTTPRGAAMTCPPWRSRGMLFCLCFPKQLSSLRSALGKNVTASVVFSEANGQAQSAPHAAR